MSQGQACMQVNVKAHVVRTALVHRAGGFKKSEHPEIERYCPTVYWMNSEP